MINGGAMIPPYMVSTCCSPYATVLPSGRRSSSGRVVGGVVAGAEAEWVMATSLLSGTRAG